MIMTFVEQPRYRVECQARPGDPWQAMTFSDGTPISLPLDNARAEARARKKLGRANPHWPDYATRVVLVTENDEAARLERRQLVIHHGIHLSREAAEAFDAGNYANALDLLKKARACAVALDAPLASDVLDTFVYNQALQ